ncbi:hypothetical protein Tco_0940998 [Tanacetum coccineum]|uniref:Uncharacterized protein n=1 Tax=Tanacetum coccineum TaxID=301880 RepID=A0ABQ5DR86_9ASTR
MIIKKDSKIIKEKVERKCIALKANKESSDEECLTSSSKDEEYAMATVKVIENALDVATQIILLENVQNHRKIRTKELLSEALGAIAPKTSHLEAVKRIFQYIKGTTHLGLWYPKGTGIETVVYADSDHAGDYVDRKSIAGHLLALWDVCLTHGSRRKQNALAISLSKPKYVAPERACQNTLRIDTSSYRLSKFELGDVTDHRATIKKGHISIEKVPFRFDNM